jgi:hypothetical protein
MEKLKNRKLKNWENRNIENWKIEKIEMFLEKNEEIEKN